MTSTAEDFCSNPCRLCGNPIPVEPTRNVIPDGYDHPPNAIGYQAFQVRARVLCAQCVKAQMELTKAAREKRTEETVNRIDRARIRAKHPGSLLEARGVVDAVQRSMQ